MASEILWFHLSKILFSSLQLKLIDTAQRWAQKGAKHKKLLNLLCIVYIKPLVSSNDLLIEYPYEKTDKVIVMEVSANMSNNILSKRRHVP